MIVLAKKSRSAADATLAQLVEQLIRNQQVVGSNPTGGSTKSREFEDFIAHLRANPSETLQIVRKLSEYVKFDFSNTIQQC
jgi:hypothetical protein